MEYAWGFAASRLPFPAEFTAPASSSSSSSSWPAPRRASRQRLGKAHCLHAPAAAAAAAASATNTPSPVPVPACTPPAAIASGPACSPPATTAPAGAGTSGINQCRPTAPQALSSTTGGSTTVCASSNPGTGPGSWTGTRTLPFSTSAPATTSASTTPFSQQQQPPQQDHHHHHHNHQRPSESWIHPRRRSRSQLDAVVAASPDPAPSDASPRRPPNKLVRGRRRASLGLTSPAAASHPSPLDRGRARIPRPHHHATMVGSESTLYSRTESATTSLSGRTMMSTGDFASRDGDALSSDKSQSQSQLQQSRPRKPFVTRNNGRTYLSDPTLPYPLPIDLREQHRQALRTLLLFQLFGGPVCAPSLASKPPTRVLEVGCGYGFWSMMCHSYFSRKGYSNISFTGVDIEPLGGIAGMPGPSKRGTPAAPSKDRGSVSMEAGNWAEQPPDKNMQWNFVQHDLRSTPYPFPDEHFDLIMSKDLSLAVKTTDFTAVVDEYMRILKPGGVLEVWDCDHPVRMLRPHVPDVSTAAPAPDECGDPSSSTSSKKSDHEKEIVELGAYMMGNNTPLSGPQNNYLIEYNGWLLKYLERQELLNFPCASIGAVLVQEPLLTNHGSKRLAIPLSEVRWEREGVGGVVTKDGKSYINTGKATGRAVQKAAVAGESNDADKKGRALGAAQLALRQTALQTVLGFIEGIEPALREVSGKKQDEWDAWMGKLMKELVERDGASCGECLEVGAWWARKVVQPQP